MTRLKARLWQPPRHPSRPACPSHPHHSQAQPRSVPEFPARLGLGRRVPVSLPQSSAVKPNQATPCPPPGTTYSRQSCPQDGLPRRQAGGMRSALLTGILPA